MNTLAALLGAGFAAASAIRPAVMSGSGTATTAERFYAYMYAARGLPLGVAGAVLPWVERGPAVTWLLFVAAATQLLDVVIGIWRKETGLIAGGAVLTVIHAATGIAVLQ